MAKFVVDLGDHPLTPEQHHAVAAAIHGAVLGEIAKHPPAPAAAPLVSLTSLDGMIRRPASQDLAQAHASLKNAAQG